MGPPPNDFFLGQGLILVAIAQERGFAHLLGVGVMLGAGTFSVLTRPTNTDVQAYIAKRQKKGTSNAEINRELAALKRSFNLALRAEKIARKPYFPMLQEHNIRKGFFERAEFETVLAHLPEYLRPPITFAYQVGWRIMSEVLPLQWTQVDLEEGTVRLEVGTTKNDDARTIYLPDVLRDVLDQQWQDHLAHYPDCPWIFHRKGKPILYPYNAWRVACQETKLTGRIPHDFRRTAVRNMVRTGIPERVAMQIAGHKTRAVFDRYNIVSKGDLKDAAKKLGQQSPAQTMTKIMTVTIPQDEQPTLSH